jgi:hypothetical protein
MMRTYRAGSWFVAIGLTLALMGEALAQEISPAATIEPADQLQSTDPDLVRLRERQRRVEMLSNLFARQTRVYRIAYRLLYAAVDMCPNRLRVAAGFTYANAYMFEGSVRTAASSMGYTHRVSIVDVAPNGAGAKAGLLPRDIFMAIDAWPVPFGEGAVTLAAAKLRDTLTRHGMATLTFRRGASPVVATVKPDYICDYRVVAVPGDSIKAYADGNRVVVFEGLLDFVGDDDDMLASIIAREIANNLLPDMDIDADDGEYSLSNFFYWGMEPEATGDPVADRARAVDHDITADYVAAYLMARSGFDHTKAPDFWYRLANLPIADGEDNYAARDTEYLLALEATIEEIDRKLAARRPLRPESDGPPPPDPVAMRMLAAAPPMPSTEEVLPTDTEVTEMPDDAIADPQPSKAAARTEVTGMPWREQDDIVAPRAIEIVPEAGDAGPVGEAPQIMTPPSPGTPGAGSRSGFSFRDWFSG